MKFRQWVLKNGGAGKIAKRFSVTRSSVYLWMSGKVIPRSPMLKKIIRAAAGQLNANDFYGK